MSTDILSRIVEEKKLAVAEARRRLPLEALRDQLEGTPPVRPFLTPFLPSDGDRINIIAEIKRASPSKGPIRPDLDAAAQAAAYEAGGAAAISVLTDAPFFRGSRQDLETARHACRLPVLRKDFIVSDYQIYESRLWGADAVLLIVRILSPSQLSEYRQLAEALGMTALVEVHAPGELPAATDAGARLIGINNRNLKTFHTDVNTAMEMVEAFGPGQIPVAASGIASRADIDANRRAGIRNFLIGESLVRADDPAGFLRELRA